MGKKIRGGSTLSRASRSMMLAFGLVASATSAQAQTSGGDANAFLRDAKAGYQFRTSYFMRRSNGDDTSAGRFRNEAWGIGGWLYGQTGELFDTLSFGGTYNFVLPLYGPDDTGFNYILRDPGQDSVSVVGELNAKLRFGNHAVVLGRQSIAQAWYLEDVVRYYNKLDQSMVGRRDVRGMQPLHYEAATVQGRFAEDTARYYGGYLWNMRQINDNEFRNLYRAAYQATVWPEGNKTGDSDGGYYAGVQWKPSRNMMLEGSWYSFDNMLDMAYVDFDYVFRMADKNYVRVGTQYMYQGGNGSNLVSGGNDFSTHYVGIYGEVKLVNWLLPYGMAGWTADDDEIRAPFSIGPSYLVQRIGENSKAGERTWILGAIVDFAPAGVKGLTFDINYGWRSDRRTASYSAGGATNLPDWDELATDLVYVYPGEGFFRNMRTRLRYARVVESGGTLQGDKIQHDLRVDLHLNIPFK